MRRRLCLISLTVFLAIGLIAQEGLCGWKSRSTKNSGKKERVLKKKSGRKSKKIARGQKAKPESPAPTPKPATYAQDKKPADNTALPDRYELARELAEISKELSTHGLNIEVYSFEPYGNGYKLNPAIE